MRPGFLLGIAIFGPGISPTRYFWNAVRRSDNIDGLLFDESRRMNLNRPLQKRRWHRYTLSMPGITRYAVLGRGVSWG